MALDPFPDTRGENSRNVKLTNEKVIEIYRRAKAGEPHRVIAKDYGVTPGAVSKISCGLNWRHVTREVTL